MREIAELAGRIAELERRVFGLMPHPEVFLRGSQHPRWTRGDFNPEAEGTGLQILRNGVAAAS